MKNSKIGCENRKNKVGLSFNSMVNSHTHTVKHSDMRKCSVKYSPADSRWLMVTETDGADR